MKSHIVNVGDSQMFQNMWCIKTEEREISSQFKDSENLTMLSNIVQSLRTPRAKTEQCLLS